MHTRTANYFTHKQPIVYALEKKNSIFNAWIAVFTMSDLGVLNLWVIHGFQNERWVYFNLWMTHKFEKKPKSLIVKTGIYVEKAKFFFSDA